MGHYLLTGVAGFIANRVAELLLADGHTVVGVDNLNDAYDVRLKRWRLARLEGAPGFEFHPVDITDRSALAALFQAARPFDAVINLAARAGVRPSVENPWIYFETNLTGALNLLDLCVGARSPEVESRSRSGAVPGGGRHPVVPKFVLASTSSLYGAHNPRPFREDADTNRPLSPYAASKKAAEALCHTYHHLHGLDVTVLRYFTVYGPAGRPDMSLFRFVQWISEERPVVVYGDGRQSRDFTYVDDIARGTIAALRPLGYKVINLGSDEPVVLMDAIRLVEGLVGEEACLEFLPRHPADILATWADIGKAERLLGWRPQTPFRQGVEQLVDWYRANRDWAREIVTI